jgi:hypothetical protein
MKLTKRLHAPSCSVLLKDFPSTTSGMYLMYPQGLSFAPPLQVYCDMTSKNGAGVTVIGHDSESRTLVDGYEDPGSYRRNITYDISMEKIVAIIDRSKKCEQFIKYECYNIFFRYRSQNPYFAWWRLSRQGSKMRNSTVENVHVE